MADRAVDRRYVRAPVGNGQPQPPMWAGNWGYDRERELVQQIGPNEHNGSGKDERGSTPQRVDRSVKQQQRRRELAEREKQRRMDLANAFDELAAMLSKIEPNEEEEEEEKIVNGNKRRRKGPISETEADTLGMNRLDLIGRTIDTLRRLHEENTDLKEHPMPGKGEEEEVLVMVPTHADGPPRGRPGGPQPFPHQFYHQQGHPPPQHQSHPQPILHSSSHDFHASPMQYYGGMNQGYGYHGGGGPGWENGPPIPQSPHRDSNNNSYYQQQPHHHPQHPMPQMLYPHQQLQQNQPQQRSDRPPPPAQPPTGFVDVPKQVGPPPATAGAGWRPRPVEEEAGSRAMPMQRPRDDSEDWVGRPMFRQY